MLDIVFLILGIMRDFNDFYQSSLTVTKLAEEAEWRTNLVGCQEGVRVICVRPDSGRESGVRRCGEKVTGLRYM